MNEQTNSTPKCMNPKCLNPQHANGLCKNCHKIATDLVASGRITWQQLYQAGKATPPPKSVEEQTRDWLTDGNPFTFEDVFKRISPDNDRYMPKNPYPYVGDEIRYVHNSAEAEEMIKRIFGDVRGPLCSTHHL